MSTATITPGDHYYQAVDGVETKRGMTIIDTECIACLNHQEAVAAGEPDDLLFDLGEVDHDGFHTCRDYTPDRARSSARRTLRNKKHY